MLEVATGPGIRRSGHLAISTTCIVNSPSCVVRDLTLVLLLVEPSYCHSFSNLIVIIAVVTVMLSGSSSTMNTAIFVPQHSDSYYKAAIFKPIL